MTFFSSWTKVRTIGATFPLLSRMVTLPERASGVSLALKKNTRRPLVRAFVSTNWIHSCADASTSTENSVLYSTFTS